MTTSHLVVANAGDCRSVLGKRDGGFHALNTVHNVNNSEERARLRREHTDDPSAVRCSTAFLDPITGRTFKASRPGFIAHEVNCYIKGMLQPSKAFGDFALKNDDSGTYITADPEVLIFPRTHDDDVLVLASDGLFDDLRPEEILRIARAAGSPGLAADRLVEAARVKALELSHLSEEQYHALPAEFRRKVHDDITALVYFFE